MRMKPMTRAVTAAMLGLALGASLLVSSASAAGKPPTAAPDTAVSRPAALGGIVAAAAGCNSDGPVVRDYRGISFGTRYCNNYRGGYTSLFGINTGYLYAGTNWFVCQQRADENPPVGSARNNIWLYTQGDVSYNATYRGWGWFPATYVSGGVNYGPIPGLRWC
jgi:hypothetical protein